MRSRDERIADETNEDRTYLCAAEGCPSRWSVDAGKGKLCSAHQWAADRSQWPLITQEQRDADTEKLIAKQNAPDTPATPKLTRAEKLSILAKLRRLFTGDAPNPRAWAYALRDREEKGEPLSVFQRAAWRSAINAPTPELELPDEAATQRLKIETARKVAAFAKERGISLEPSPEDHQSRAQLAEQRARAIGGRP